MLKITLLTSFSLTQTLLEKSLSFLSAEFIYVLKHISYFVTWPKT